jgi:hypothetical protein
MSHVLEIPGWPAIEVSWILYKILRHMLGSFSRKTFLAKRCSGNRVIFSLIFTPFSKFFLQLKRSAIVLLLLGKWILQNCNPENTAAIMLVEQ